MVVKQFLRGGCATLLLFTAFNTHAQITLDFETDDFGATLINGQSISTFSDVLAGETVFEFGNYVNISTLQRGRDSHLGAAIFDSTPGVNPADPDLWVNKGNILILQNDGSPWRTVDTAHGWVFSDPNDEKDFKDRGSIVFDFNLPSELISIDLIDIDRHAHVTLTLFDQEGDLRIYSVPSRWTTDVTRDPLGWQTLFLNILTPQPSEPKAHGHDAVVILDEEEFDFTRVVRLDVAFDGQSTSAGLDELVFLPRIPEPSSAALGLLGLVALAWRRTRRTR